MESVCVHRHSHIHVFLYLDVIAFIFKLKTLFTVPTNSFCPFDNKKDAWPFAEGKRSQKESSALSLDTMHHSHCSAPYNHLTFYLHQTLLQDIDRTSACQPTPCFKSSAAFVLCPRTCNGLPRNTCETNKTLERSRLLVVDGIIIKSSFKLSQLSPWVLVSRIRADSPL